MASGADELSAGDLLIALVDNASSANQFMSIQLNIDDGVVDEVKNFTDQSSFPATGQVGIVYIADDVNEAFIWDGASYKAMSLPNISHYGSLGLFPSTGSSDILYIADDTNLVYFWDSVAYIPLSGAASNFYAVDGALTGHRTVSGASKNLTFTGILAYTLSSATYDLVVTGNMEESIGGNKIVEVVGSSSETSAGKAINSIGPGNNITLTTDFDGAIVIPKSPNPDANISTPVTGMIKYDTTDNDFRAYQGYSWRSLINISRHATLSAFPTTGSLDKMYIADDTDDVYIWNGTAYTLNGASSIYTSDGAITGDRTITGDENLILFTNTNWRAITGDGAYLEVDGDTVGIHGPTATTISGSGFNVSAVSGVMLNEPATNTTKNKFFRLGCYTFCRDFKKLRFNSGKVMGFTRCFWYNSSNKSINW